MAVISAFQSLENIRAVEPLRETEEIEVDGRIKRRAYEVIKYLYKQAKKSEEIAKLRNEVEEATKKTKELEATITKLQAIVEKDKD